MAKMNIHAFSDTIMQGIMERLDIPIPQWIVRRRVRVTRENTSDENNYGILIEGRDPDNTNIPFTLFKSVQINNGEKKIKQIHNEPFLFQISKTNSDQINIQLQFFGHYNEIPFTLSYININNIPQEEEFYLFYNPMIGQWRKTTEADDFPL
jgi:mono-ADP-ribosyltransferase sirtuin 6